MTANQTKTPVVSEFKPKQNKSPFVGDPHNTRGGKGGKGGAVKPVNGNIGGKKMNIGSNLKKGGSGDR